MKLRALVLSFGVLCLFVPAYSANVPKAGASCSKVGITQNYNGKKYTCIKSGKKLIWNSGVTIKKPVLTASPSMSSSPSPSPSPTSSPLSSPSPSPSPSPAQSPSQSVDEFNGKICSNENENLRNSSGEYVCMKANDGVLRWAKNNRILTPGSRPSLSPIKYDINQYFEPQIPADSLENCKIKENSDQGTKNGDGLASGFPFMPRYQTYPKKITMALIPIDFADFIGDKDFKTRVQKDLQNMSDWYKEVSDGRLTIDWKVSEQWIRLPGNSNDYYVDSSGKYPDTVNFWKQVLPIVDSKFDLTGVQTINFLLPLNQKFIYESVQSFSFLSEMKQYNSTKTQIISFAAGGEVFQFPGTNLWSYWAHEFGHQIGLAHVGMSRGAEEPMSGLELIGNQNGPYRELGGWMRFIIGWLSDNQIYCHKTSGFTSNDVSLVPLNDSKNGIKLVVIPTGSESAIVIDSRRPTKYSCDTPNLPGGVLVYTYNARLGNQSYFLTAKYPSDRKPTIGCETGTIFPDVFLHTGDSVQVGSYKIAVTSSGTFDQIRITKTN